MRRLVLIILIGILTFMCIQNFAQNRVASQSDVIKYGAYITPGDLILDRPTNPVPLADNINQLRYTKVSAAFPAFRENGTIWIDGDKIGKLCEIRFLNVNETTPWHVSNVTIKPIPNTRVDGVYTTNSYGGFLYLIQGVKFLTMNGNSKAFPGLIGIKKGDFVKGRFGFGATSTGIYEGYHAYSISVLDGGKFYFTGFEGEHGFSVLRFQGGYYDWTVTLHAENFYIHDTSSEGKYIKATHALPVAHGSTILRNGIIARAGSEAIQLQHSTGETIVENITIFSASAGHLKQFQPNQDTGIQLGADGGTTIFQNIILDSWGSHAFNCFGSPYTDTKKKTLVRNMAFLNGRGECIYFHPSTKYGMTWEFENLYIGRLNYEWYINNKAVKTNWLISANNGTDTVRVKNIRFDGSTILFQNTSKIAIGTLFKSTVPDVEYVNSGFTESANRIKFYEQYYGKYLTGVDNKAVDYKAGDILEDREPGHQPVFVKCLVDNTATDLRPKYDPVKYMILKWDAFGTRNDQPGYMGDKYNYPPDDLRIKYENFYGQQGIGFVEEAPDYFELLQQANKIIQKKDSTINVLQSKITGIFQDIEKYK